MDFKILQMCTIHNISLIKSKWYWSLHQVVTSPIIPKFFAHFWTGDSDSKVHKPKIKSWYNGKKNSVFSNWSFFHYCEEKKIHFSNNFWKKDFFFINNSFWFWTDELLLNTCLWNYISLYLIYCCFSNINFKFVYWIRYLDNEGATAHLKSNVDF